MNVCESPRGRILAEIRRLAGVSGQPPGRLLFERETGIRPSAWRGVFWARWSDAVREAGFEANEAQSKIDDGVFLSKLAESLRHFGRVPTTVELRLYRKTDPAFPAHSTIDNRFRSKAEMLSAISSWTRTRPEWADVAAMLEGVGLEGVTVASNSPSEIRREGLVYLIKSGDHFKIGRSDEIERRVREIRLALPEAATLVHAIRTDDPSGIEAYWHRRFADRRANGEWFRLTAPDVAAFKRRRCQ